MQTWAAGAFLNSLPGTRHDAVELRAWLDQQLAELAAEHTTDGKAHALAYAEAAAQLYSTAYYELARQVHIPA